MGKHIRGMWGHVSQGPLFPSKRSWHFSFLRDATCVKPRFFLELELKEEPHGASWPSIVYSCCLSFPAPDRKRAHVSVFSVQVADSLFLETPSRPRGSKQHGFNIVDVALSLFVHKLSPPPRKVFVSFVQMYCLDIKVAVPSKSQVNSNQVALSFFSLVKWRPITHWKDQVDWSLRFAINLDYYTKRDTIYWYKSTQDRSPKHNLSSLSTSYFKGAIHESKQKCCESPKIKTQNWNQLSLSDWVAWRSWDNNYM